VLHPDAQTYNSLISHFETRSTCAGGGCRIRPTDTFRRLNRTRHQNSSAIYWQWSWT
jgi:hypothetical protein